VTKTIGAAAILLGCCLAALCRVRAKKARIELLCAARDCLMQLRRELEERRCGMPELFEKLARQNEGQRTGAFFKRLGKEMDALGEKRFSEIWRAAAKEIFALPEEAAAEALAAPGGCLGGSELELQCAALERAAREMERLSQTEREALGAERRMSYGLSLSAGALLVIMLI
jgi:stage III sporulation protein AB